MATRQQLSIRARLTLLFALALGLVLALTGVALISLVHHSLETEASNDIPGEMQDARQYFSQQIRPSSRAVVLHSDDNVVVQVTNLDGTKVWAASSPIANDPILAHGVASPLTTTGFDATIIRSHKTTGISPHISMPQVATIRTKRGLGLVFGFVYDDGIAHNMRVLTASLLISFPLLLLLSGGLIYFGMGLALAPVESIRRRVDAIAASDLTNRVPQTGGDDEIARMAKTVNAMLDRLEAASQFEQEFVSNASHELRSPLTTLLVTTERAQRDPERANWPEVGDVVMREGRRLETLIDDLSWLARHDEHRVDIQCVDVDLDDLLFEESQRVRLLSTIGVDTTMIQPTRVKGDPAMMKRMIRNVVDNATRYASTELRFDSHYEGDEAVVTVADDGEGLDVSQSVRLFDRFVRADRARSRHSGGTGLGLAIVSEIVVRHGGSVRFVVVETGSKIELRVRRDGRANVPRAVGAHSADA
jgi:signal transduction histidine kinase